MKFAYCNMWNHKVVLLLVSPPVLIFHLTGNTALCVLPASELFASVEIEFLLAFSFAAATRPPGRLPLAHQRQQAARLPGAKKRIQLEKHHFAICFSFDVDIRKFCQGSLSGAGSA